MKLFWAHPSAIIDDKAHIGANTKIWHHTQVLAGAYIGTRCSIGHNCFIGSKAHIGNGVKIESNTDIWDLVKLEDYVFVGPSAVFTNDLNPRAEYPKKKFPQFGTWLPTVVKKGATIGANATILCGITIGEYALIGAGSVVTKDIPLYALIIGVPGKLAGWICECGTKLTFKNKKSVCSVCHKRYYKQGKVIRQI